MAIYTGSRYETATKQTVIGTDGVSRDFVYGGHALTADDVRARSLVVRVVGGEMIDEYAFLQCRKTRNWWMIAQVNDLDYPLPPLDDEDTDAQMVANLPVMVPEKRLMARF